MSRKVERLDLGRDRESPWTDHFGSEIDPECGFAGVEEGLACVFGVQGREIADPLRESAPSPPATAAPGSPEGPTPPPPLVGQPSACEPHRAMIEKALADRRNGMAIYQELVDDHGFTGSYSSVRRFVRKLRGEVSRAAHAVIHTDPGEEAQVDYGEGPMVRDPHTGKHRRTRLFVMTLGRSRKSVRLLVWRSSSRVWAELHEKAFRRLGGCVRVVVLDNLREGVLKPDIYDPPTLNPLYRDMLAHYGMVGGAVGPLQLRESP
jgi:transposase